MSYQRLDGPAEAEHRYYAAPPGPQTHVPLQQQQQQPPQQQYYQPHPSPFVQQLQPQQQQQVPHYQPAPYQAGYAVPPQQYVGAPVPPYGSAPLIQTAHPGVAGHVIRGIWSDGIFDCFDSGVICLLSLFFPCIRWSMTISRAKYLTLPAALIIFALPYLIVQGCYTYLSIQYPETYGTDNNTQYDSVYIALMSIMSICRCLIALILILRLVLLQQQDVI